jgi:hypothetical protein
MFADGALRVSAAGMGRAVATGLEKLEQAVTGLPVSDVPARRLFTMLGRRPLDTAKPVLHTASLGGLTPSVDHPPPHPETNVPGHHN